jgi:alkylhydroperoxidase family enzyme
VGSELGVSEEKILALDEYAASPLYDEKERVALGYADAITLSDRDVSDELFSRVRRFFDDEALVELTAIIAWEIFVEQVQPRLAGSFSRPVEARRGYLIPDPSGSTELPPVGS